MNPYAIPWMDDDLEVFRDTVVRFIETEMVPHDARWREQHHVDRETWRKVGETGLLLLDVPAEYGGGGGDFRHEAVLYTELARRGLASFGQGVHSMCAHYVLNHGSEEQKRRFLPSMAARPSSPTVRWPACSCSWCARIPRTARAFPSSWWRRRTCPAIESAVS